MFAPEPYDAFYAIMGAILAFIMLSIGTMVGFLVTQLLTLQRFRLHYSIQLMELK